MASPASTAAPGQMVTSRHGAISGLNVTINLHSVPYGPCDQHGQPGLSRARRLHGRVSPRTRASPPLRSTSKAVPPTWPPSRTRRSGPLEPGVPIVALKAGASELGSRSRDPYSSLAGDDALYDALFDRLAIAPARVGPRSCSRTREAAVRRAAAGRPRLAAFTCSGGNSLMVADAAFPARHRAAAADLRLRDQAPVPGLRPSPTRSTTTPRSGVTARSWSAASPPCSQIPMTPRSWCWTIRTKA